MPDPLDALRTPTWAVAPDTAFAQSLRAQLTRTLLLQRGATMSAPGSRTGDIAYISLVTPDLGRAKAFYAAVLGWTYAPGASEHGVQVLDTRPMIGIGQGGPAGAVLSLAVDDVEAGLERVRRAGGLAGAVDRRPYGRISSCQTPDGLAFDLLELAEAVPAGSANGLRSGDISYISLEAADVARAQEFFGSVVGWFAAAAGDTAVPVPEVGLDRSTRERSEPVLCYRVDDIDAAVGAVRAAGGSAGEVADRSYAREADCADDQGTRFYLHQFA